MAIQMVEKIFKVQRVNKLYLQYIPLPWKTTEARFPLPEMTARVDGPN